MQTTYVAYYFIGDLDNIFVGFIGYFDLENQ